MNDTVNRVLVVEDEYSIRKFININLERSGFEVLEAQSGEEALEVIRANDIGFVVLDVMLPGIDGFEVCQKIRADNPEIAIIMLTARGQDMDRIMGLELGADDYMVKPFNPLELVARLRSIGRRMGRKASDDAAQSKHGNIVLNFKAQKLMKNNKEIELTPREFAIMAMFVKNPGKALSRDDILNEVWGRNYFGDIKTVDVHIRRLREKIEDNASEPQYIKTVWGLGYLWELNS